MKKIVLLSLFLFINLNAQEESNIEQYEIPLYQEETDTEELVFPPLSINISVANIQEAHSNNKISIAQDQTITQKKLEAKKQHQYENLLKYAKGAVLVALVLSGTRSDPATLCSAWRLLW